MRLQRAHPSPRSAIPVCTENLIACRGLLPDACRDFDEGSDYDDQSGRLHPEVIGKTTLVPSLRIGRRHHGDHE